MLEMAVRHGSWTAWRAAASSCRTLQDLVGLLGQASEHVPLDESRLATWGVDVHELDLAGSDGSIRDRAPRPAVFLRPALDGHQRIVTLAHEIGHLLVGAAMRSGLTCDAAQEEQLCEAFGQAAAAVHLALAGAPGKSTTSAG